MICAEVLVGESGLLLIKELLALILIGLEADFLFKP